MKISTFSQLSHETDIDRLNIPVPQIPHQAGLILIWPSPHAGSGTSSRRRSSLPCMRRAFIVPIFELRVAMPESTFLNGSDMVKDTVRKLKLRSCFEVQKPGCQIWDEVQNK